ncbi:hypothetical protein [Edaphobacter aggregans]|uniref:hypothetical protein n=1 Tax=Edaphobacter aggregans TaxID=570835 RepID=UPI00163B3E7A|nr:hypothetical protein [Edaphobacter aggregans]
MSARQVLALGASVLALSFLGACRRSPTEPMQGRVVRLAELEIDPVQLEAYKAALREEIDTSIRIEPGVLTLFRAWLVFTPDLATDCSARGERADSQLFWQLDSLRLRLDALRLPRPWLSRPRREVLALADYSQRQ